MSRTCTLLVECDMNLKNLCLATVSLGKGEKDKEATLDEMFKPTDGMNLT